MIELKKSGGYIYYIAFCIALLPILILRDFTPSNELRYLSIADEALRNHTFFTFTNHGIPYADKPPLYLWIVMLGKWLFGSHQMWFLSLASLIPAIITVRTMEQWTARELDGASAKTAQMLMLTCGLFAGLAVTLRMDMLMCMFIVLALRTFYRMAVMHDTCKATAWLFPVYVFLAVFSKGPVGLLVPLFSTLVFLIWKRQIKQFGRYWGWRTWGVLLAGCLIWFCAVYSEGGTAYLDNLLFHQTIDRAVNSFHHKEPFYYYGISVWYSIAPWSLVVIGLLVAAICKRLISTDLQRFYCTIIFTTFIILSCISSKLQVYLLPAFPFMVYLSAIHLPRFKGATWLNVLFAVTAMLFVAILPAVVVITKQESTAHIGHGLVYAAASLLTLGGAAALWTRFGTHKDMTTSLRIMAASLTCAIFVGGWALPSINPWIGYGELCKKTLEIDDTKKTDNIAVWNIKRPENMDVYFGRPVEILQDDNLVEINSLHRPAVLMLRKCDLKYFDGLETWIVGPNAIVYLKQGDKTQYK